MNRSERGSIDFPRIKKGVKKGVRIVAAGATMTVAGWQAPSIARGLSELGAMKEKSGALHDATADLGKATRDLSFQAPDTTTIGGIEFVNGSIHPNSADAGGTLGHAGVKLAKADVPRAKIERLRAIEESISANTSSATIDYPEVRSKITVFAESLNSYRVSNNKAESDKTGEIIDSTIPAIAIPVLWGLAEITPGVFRRIVEGKEKKRKKKANELSPKLPEREKATV